MRIIFGIKIGGLQQRIFNLLQIFLIALIAVFAVFSVYQSRSLTEIVQDAGEKQTESIEEISEETMRQVLEQSLTKSTAMQAYIADDLFTNVRTDVGTLREFATELFAHEGQFSAHPYAEPDAANDGKASVQMQHEEGVDPSGSSSLGLVANMSEIMLAMFENSGTLSSCFVATADGCILFVDDRSASYVSEDGEVYPFEVRERTWYTQAVDAGEMIFTGVETDAFTGIQGLVCAAPVYRDDGELAAVVGADIFLTAIDEYVNESASEGGFLCVVNGDGEVLFSPQEEGTFSTRLSQDATDLREAGSEALADFVAQALNERTPLCDVTVDGVDYYMTGAPLDTVGWAVLSVVDKELVHQPTAAMIGQYRAINDKALDSYSKGSKSSMRIFIILTVLVFVLAMIGALVVAQRITGPVEKMTRRIQNLKEGDIAFEMDDAYRTGDEIEILAESFAMLSKRTRDYITQITQITAEKERVGAELALATKIQADMLPSIFPAFPERKEFDLYASMTPAKEVGGDFYDFFLIDEDHLCMVMADVSGKGIPAAMFMMFSKNILANNAMLGKSPAKILEDANAAVCANNSEDMFVTVWMGILEISTGRLTASNAGHEYPALRQADGSFELFKDKHGMSIGWFDFAEYEDYEIRLTPGARLFLYTDGVAEATDANEELFGTDRMLDALNSEPLATPKQMLTNMRDAVDGFVKEAEQFDDLTMLALEYKGK